MRKHNIFGTSNFTVGQNVMAAVEGEEQAVGIPPYHYGNMVDIMKEALNEDELDLLCQGFGINRPKQKQIEILKNLGLSKNECSRKAHRAVGKLQAYPYKTRLRALVPTVEELFSTIEELQAAVNKANEVGASIKEANHRLKAAEKSLSDAKITEASLREENARLQNDITQLTSKADTMKQELDNASNKVTELTCQLRTEAEKASAVKGVFDAAIENLKKDFASSMEAAEKSFVASLRDAEVRGKALEGFHLSEKALLSLNRVGIRDLERLRSMHYRNLASLIGKKYADEVKEALRREGVSLKVG